jgi:hypothetical protein
MRTTTRVLVALLTLSAMSALAACGGDDDDSASSTATTESAASSSSTEPATSEVPDDADELAAQWAEELRADASEDGSEIPEDEALCATTRVVGELGVEDAQPIYEQDLEDRDDDVYEEDVARLLASAFNECVDLRPLFEGLLGSDVPPAVAECVIDALAENGEELMFLSLSGQQEQFEARLQAVSAPCEPPGA